MILPHAFDGYSAVAITKYRCEDRCTAGDSIAKILQIDPSGKIQMKFRTKCIDERSNHFISRVPTMDVRILHASLNRQAVPPL